MPGAPHVILSSSLTKQCCIRSGSGRSLGCGRGNWGDCEDVWENVWGLSGNLGGLSSNTRRLSGYVVCLSGILQGVRATCGGLCSGSGGLCWGICSGYWAPARQLSKATARRQPLINFIAPGAPAAVKSTVWIHWLLSGIGHVDWVMTLFRRLDRQSNAPGTFWRLEVVPTEKTKQRYCTRRI